MNTLLATLLSGSGEVFDTTYSLAIETGQVEQADPDWDTVAYWSEPSVGIRAGRTINPNLEILGSIHYASTSNNDQEYYYYEDEGYNTTFSGFSADVTETLVHVGPKFNWNIKPWFAPYATAQGLVVHNRIRLADDYSLEEEDSITFVSASGVGVGLTGALGLELRTRPIAKKSQLFFYGEGGSTVASPIEFSLSKASSDGSDLEIGDLTYGGQYVRFGMGARF